MKKKNPFALHKLDWLEKLTCVLAIWFLIYPKPYDILMGVLLVIPIAGIIINGLQKPSIASLVEVTKDKEGVNKYDVADFIDIAAWIILIRVLLDYEFESFYSLLLPGAVAFVLMLLILLLTHRLIVQSTKNKWWIYISIIFNVFLYSYAGTYAINCTYDYSKPEIYKNEVLDKHTSRRRRGGTTYYVTVKPWGNHYEKEDISVSMQEYQKLQIGDEVEIAVKKGVFNIP
ncbi:hypothetical protein [Capnocytophaga sp.]|uniref:hypothetical protein n=1 Tax=Capnocytophaga sp. TaxID=44737 RepID=UPI0026DAFE4A|nr:hypothetical protein [Capnocytophaga sp.]MDO5104803.1 hypothetical protein [Capnocytophaga sp.]